MSIHKRSNGWRAEAWVGRRRIKSQSGFTTKADARSWHDATVSQYRANPRSLQKVVEYEFDELLSRFETIHFPTISKGTQNRYKLDIKKRIQPYFQYRKLNSINHLLIESFRAEIMKELSPKSVNNCTDLLRSLFRKAEEWGMVEKKPIKLKPLKLPDVKYTWWDEKHHIQAFLTEAKKTPYYAAYLLALECGMRLGEIVGLSKQDVDLESCRLHIHRQWLDEHNEFGPTKGRRERFITFNPHSDLKEALNAAIAKSPHPEALFVTKTGRRIRGTKLRAHHFPMLLRRSKVPRIRFHDQRHTFASWYMIENDDIWSLKSILGHTDIQTTQRYAHLSKRRNAPTLNFKI